MSQLVKTKRQLILTILSDLPPLRGSSNKETLYSTRSCVNWAVFGTRGPRFTRVFCPREKKLSCVGYVFLPKEGKKSHFTPYNQGRKLLIK
jgi:hypothetical protein